MKMKSWLDRVMGREDWASRALQLGLEAFERESGGRSGRARSVPTARHQPEAGSAEASLEVDPDSVPTLP
jgi:hypothetical protein